MAKTTITLRLEPHEMHIVKEALRVMSTMMEAMLDGKDMVRDYEFNPGVYENAHLMYLDLEGLRVSLGMEPPPPPNIRPRQTQRTQPQRQSGGSFWKDVKSAYRTGQRTKRGISKILKF